MALDERRVLEDVSLSVGAGSVVGLVGPNGAGKTTLLRAVAGIAPLSAGTISVNGCPHARLSRAERAKMIGYLPQDRAVHWPLTVRRIVELGRLPHLEPWRAVTAMDAAAVRQALHDTDILALAERSISTLSGGEAARVAIARMLAGEPKVILADEPTAGLDPAHKLEVLALFRRLAGAGRAVVTALHDLTLAARYCDRIVMLQSGRMVADGAPQDVFSAPLLSAVFGIDAKIAKLADELVILPWASRRADSAD
ncbi:MAG: ABC transporter ATP-binding protein [Rhodospirillaceae bacterium]|nr:ABC transporter ATP-binding protein [Rhodospirillaceae bacterium]